MRSFALAYIILVTFQSSYSQKIVFEYDPPFKANSGGRVFSTRILNSSDTGKTVYIIHNENDIIYLLLSNQFAIEKKLSTAILNSVYQHEGNRYLGSVINDKTGVAYSVHLFIKAQPQPNTKQRQHFRIETINFTNQTLREEAFFEPEETEQYLAAFGYQNKFYLVTCFNDPKRLIVRSLNEYGLTTKKDFALSGLDGVLMQDQLFNYLSPASSFVSNSDFKNIGADYPVKLFMENEKTILFTIATHKKAPELIRLDLETSKTEIIQLKSDELCISDDKKHFNRNNSYYYEGKLYVLNICKRKAQLFIFDMPTLAIEKKYEMSEAEAIQFSETPVMYSNRDGRRTTDYLIYKTDILREFQNGAAKIFINNEASGKRVITFGVYSETSESGDPFVRSTILPADQITGAGGSRQGRRKDKYLNPYR